MGQPDSALRIVRGVAGEEELAAVTVVLCAVLAARCDDGAGEAPGAPPGGADGPAADVPPWRPERSAASYRSPYNWR
ncbi:acyl-CoA carboxylase subunit epsilon [Streptomyces sp. NPDC056568]|uniref:acyl-CoA carboxylase subunit epsilon n=1 Tax=Streptomyces sp. NPDC056568 TaxID=3345866 RepID=UPI0036AD7655